MVTPKTIEDMEKVIEQWANDVDGHESMDRTEMLECSGQLLSIISFMENK